MNAETVFTKSTAMGVLPFIISPELTKWMKEFARRKSWSSSTSIGDSISNGVAEGMKEGMGDDTDLVEEKAQQEEDQKNSRIEKDQKKELVLFSNINNWIEISVVEEEIKFISAKYVNINNKNTTTTASTNSDGDANNNNNSSSINSFSTSNLVNGEEPRFFIACVKNSEIISTNTTATNTTVTATNTTVTAMDPILTALIYYCPELAPVRLKMIISSSKVS